jgi:hypothetical protein
MRKLLNHLKFKWALVHSRKDFPVLKSVLPTDGEKRGTTKEHERAIP